MSLTVLFGLLGAVGAFASPVEPRENATSPSMPTTPKAAPSVTIYPSTANGDPVTLMGSRSFGQDRYLGLPFASPPVDDLRFVAPQTAMWNTTTFNATVQPPACIQSSSATYSAYGYSEDCLYLNVHTPAGANATNAHLPVMVWIYGGSFTSGAASFYDPTILMTQAATTERPIVFVALNYRLGVLGFPYGEEVAENNAANLGLRDVQKGLEWVQEHIRAFGGNPDQVTVFGQSAGAILISLLYLQPELNLFKSAIMQSGAQSTAPIGPTGSTWQEPFDALVNFAGCNTSANSTMGNATLAGNFTSSFECLKSLPAAQILAAQQRVKQVPQYSSAFIFAPSIDGDLVPDSPHKLLEEGKFAHIPYISGNVKDEGTIFVPTALPDNETIAAVSFAASQPGGLSRETLLQLFGQVYPNVPAQGSPFGTGNNTFGLSPVFKQAAAILGDAAFQANRRWFLQQSAAQGFNQTWSYHFETTLPSLPPQQGSYHGLDVFYVFGLPQLSQLNVTGGGGAAALSGLASRYNFTAADVVLAQTMTSHWLNFAYFTDPNGQATDNATYWPKYGSELNLLNFDQGNVSVIPDTYRQEKMEFFLQRPEAFNYRRSVGV